MSKPAPSRAVANRKRTFTLYAKTVQLMMESPVTAVDVCARLNVTRNNTRMMLRRMVAQKIAHVCGWRGSDERNFPLPLFTFGEGVRAPCPPCVTTGLPIKHNVAQERPIAPRAELTAFCSLVKAMQERPKSIAELCDETGISEGTMRELVNLMHSLEVVHVADWEQRLSGGAPSRLFLFGRHSDAPRPKAMTSTVISRRYRAARAQKVEQMTLLRALSANATPFTEAA